EQEQELDTSFSLPGHARFRVNVYYQRDAIGSAFRLIPFEIKTIEELGLPTQVAEFARMPRGLVLFTGPTGSGKSTSLASLVDMINSDRDVHLLTVEDPIEILHPDKRSIVVQREVGVDTPHPADAVRAAMRHDADVIVVSELTDHETAGAAIDAAETGHLVISAMRTTDPAETINRLISMFPESRRSMARTQLAAQLRGIVSQMLIDAGDGRVVLACEVLTNSERAEEWILSDREPAHLMDIIKDSSFYGMQTFDQALLGHVVNRTVDLGAVLPYARNTHEIRAKAMSAGLSI
ncbi:MAG: PilT/PilU family type 4a pilus ATPase, partial [Actinobacteria bacterium]|nr:PilT/PilU family type 4a pilus ATPase [Actinomycetota bacterium]